jgi:hypothetical protein
MTNFKLIFIFVLIFIDCQNKTQEPFNENKRAILHENKKKVTICIQPFDDISKTDLDCLQSGLKKIYSQLKVNPRIALPAIALNYNQTRYRADTLIKFLNRINNGVATFE